MAAGAKGVTFTVGTEARRDDSGKEELGRSTRG
jgi:hypothetical protein